VEIEEDHAFLPVVVAFPGVSAGREDEYLLGVVRELYEELGYSDAAVTGPSAGWRAVSQAGLWSSCDGEDLVPRLREALAKLAWIANGESEGEERERQAVRAALDGAELVMRGEIASNRPERIATHLPGFAFTVTFMGLGRERAIELSQRAAELIEGGPSDG
jgi:hypothetical protein